MKHLSVKFIQAVTNAINGKFGKRVISQSYLSCYKVVVGFTLALLTWNLVSYVILGLIGK